MKILFFSPWDYLWWVREQSGEALTLDHAAKPEKLRKRPSFN